MRHHGPIPSRPSVSNASRFRTSARHSAAAAARHLDHLAQLLREDRHASPLSRSLATRRIVPRRPQIPGCDNAYCKYAVVHGDDWTHLDGPADGISQITRKTSGDSDQKLV